MPTIKFYLAEDLQRRISEIVSVLGLGHVDIARVVAVRSIGSASRRTIARCYALPRIWQAALARKAVYLVEVISERYDRLSEEEKDRVLIHEIMHIPASFGGGFRHHKNYVTERNVESLYREYVKRRGKGQETLLSSPGE
ncbi:MAG: putative metallopeptidase [archaeon]